MRSMKIKCLHFIHFCPVFHYQYAIAETQNIQLNNLIQSKYPYAPWFSAFTYQNLTEYTIIQTHLHFKKTMLRLDCLKKSKFSIYNNLWSQINGQFFA